MAGYSGVSKGHHCACVLLFFLDCMVGCFALLGQQQGTGLHVHFVCIWSRHKDRRSSQRIALWLTCMLARVCTRSTLMLQSVAWCLALL